MYVPREIGVIFVMPQTVVLIVAAWGANQAVWSNHYADGAPYPFAFIAADQLPVLLIAILHTVAIIHTYWPARTNRMHSYYSQYNDFV